MKCSDQMQRWLDWMLYVYMAGLGVELLCLLLVCCSNFSLATSVKTYLFSANALFGIAVYVIGFTIYHTLDEPITCYSGTEKNMDAANLITAQIILGWIIIALVFLFSCFMCSTYLRILFGK